MTRSKVLADGMEIEEGSPLLLPWTLATLKLQRKVHKVRHSRRWHEMIQEAKCRGDRRGTRLKRIDRVSPRYRASWFIDPPVISESNERLTCVDDRLADDRRIRKTRVKKHTDKLPTVKRRLSRVVSGDNPFSLAAVCFLKHFLYSARLNGLLLEGNL